MKTTHPTRRAIFGIAAVILIVIFSNWLMQATPLGSKTLDLTENHRHTLTAGTRAILDELDKPVIIRYYATRKSEAMPRRVKNYMHKVDHLLKQYQKLSHGHIQIEHLDPQPDTDAEDSAQLDNISGQRVNDENLYFGLSISCLDRQTPIPFLDPANETMLEYLLSSAIANVTTFEKKSIGLMTGLPLAGKTSQMPGVKNQPPWIIYRELQQYYHLKNLGMEPKELDPKKISVLLLIHPAPLSPETEYLIDQYLLKGGIVVACLDPYALTAPPGNPVTPATPKYSTFPHLLSAWGIGMDATSVVADGKFASDFGQNRRMYAHLALTQDAIASKDEVITQGFNNIYFPLAGGFTINESVPGISVTPILQSSKEVILMAPKKSLKPDPGLFARRTSLGKKFNLVLRLEGSFPSAFPNGNPHADKSKNPPVTHLKKSLTKGIVYLISDADFLYDTASFAPKQENMPVNNNAALLENILDQCTGSKHLIGSRSRASTIQPFTVIKNMETEFAQEIREDVEKAKISMNQIVAQLQELQAQKSKSKNLVLSQEQEAKILQLQDQQIQLKRELREKQKGLRARKDKLYSKITWLTVATTPTFVALVGIFVWLVRRRKTRAQ